MIIKINARNAKRNGRLFAVELRQDRNKPDELIGADERGGLHFLLWNDFDAKGLNKKYALVDMVKVIRQRVAPRVRGKAWEEVYTEECPEQDKVMGLFQSGVLCVCDTQAEMMEAYMDMDSVKPESKPAECVEAASPEELLEKLFKPYRK